MNMNSISSSLSQKLLVFTTILLMSILSITKQQQQSLQKYNSCEEVIFQTNFDEEVLEQMKYNIEPFIKDHEKCIDMLLNSGNYNSAEYLMDHLLLNKVKFRDSLKKSVTNIEVAMKELYNKYRFDEEDFQVVVPAIQWAQSLNQVFLHIKFSHRHDSPGCAEVKNLNIDLLPNELYMTAYCVQADIPIKFELKLPFFVPIAPEESKHSEEANGRYVFSLMKGQTGMFWDRLVHNPEDYPKNTKMWLEMHEKYKNEVEKFMEDDEEEEFKQLMADISKKKKKGRKKKVTFNK